MDNRNTGKLSDPIKPSFLITIDTEGDNLWALNRDTTTQNASFLPRFQFLCESKGFKPTYLADYAMAKSPAFVEFGKDLIEKDTAEIGMHLHAWDTPPIVPLTNDDQKFHPYLIEYPETVMAEKIKTMTDLLEETFQIRMFSHRAGRWSFNESYAKLLVKYGYCVDCSVTPYVSWGNQLGDPNQCGGADFTHFPDGAYFMDLHNISLPGTSSLLEVPVSIMRLDLPFVEKFRKVVNGFPMARRFVTHFYPPIVWLRPQGKNLKWMLWIVKQSVLQKRSYIEFMLHSSELMPGGSPTFRNERDIDSLYDDLNCLFDEIKDSGFVGRTLFDHYQICRQQQ